MVGETVKAFATYATMIFMNLIIIAQLLAATVRHNSRSPVKVHRLLYWAFAAFGLVQLSGLAWATIEWTGFSGKFGIYISNIVWFGSICVGTFLWFIFCEFEASTRLSRSVVRLAVTSIPLIVAMVIILSTGFTGLLFYVDENGAYQRGTMISVISTVPLVYVSAASIHALIRAAVIQDKEERLRNFFMAWFAVPVLVTSIVQNATGWHLMCSGYTLGVIQVFMNLVMASNFRLTIRDKQRNITELKQNEENYRNTVETERLSAAKASARSLEVIRSLAEDFAYVCHCNMETNEITRYHANSDFVALMEKLPSSHPSVNNIDAMFEFIGARRENGKKITSSYLWTKQRIVKDEGFYTENFTANLDGDEKYYRLRVALDMFEPNGVVVGFYCVDEEIRKQRETEKLNTALNEMTNDYDALFLINSDGEIEHCYKEKEYLSEYFNHADDDYESLEQDEFAKHFVLPEDRKMYLEETKTKNIFAGVSGQESYAVRFRMINNPASEDDRSLWYEVRAVALSREDASNHVLLGLRNIDDEVSAEIERQRTINEAERIAREQEERAMRYAILQNLGDDYDCIITLEIGNSSLEDKTEIYRDSELLKNHIDGWKNAANFTDMARLLAQHISSEDEVGEFETSINRKTIIERLNNSASYYVDFKIKLDNVLHFYQMKFTAKKNDNNEITSLIVGIRNIDDEVRDRNKLIALEQESIARRAFSNLFIDTYISAYYLNVKDGSYIAYKDDGPYSHLLKGATDYRGAMIKMIEQYVAPEDSVMLKSMLSVAEVKDTVRKEAQFSAIVKVDFGGEYKYCKIHLVQGHDADHFAVGISDVNDEYVREKNIQKDLQDNIATIEEQQRQLEEASKAKSNFLFNMSHDIRTPMNAIMGYTELAKTHIEEKERVDDFLGKITQASEHLLNLINEILDMSRIEIGKIQSIKKTVKVVDEAKGVIDICAEDAGKNNITLVSDFDGVSDKLIEADVLHVNRIMINIIGNAIKYTKPGGRVVYSIKEYPGDAKGYQKYVFTVTDNGMGISEEFLSQIYESFTRERNSTVSGIQGTGLGMSIVKRLVEYLDGNIQIESKVNEGTTVNVTLQFRLMEEETPVEKPLEKKETSLEGKMALIVEDNDMNRDIISAILQEKGIESEEAVNGAEAVEKLKNEGPERYDFILMDIQMPVMDGYEATHQIREMYPDSRIPIIALSANAFEEDRLRSLEAGMDDHQSKPISPENLYNSIRKFVH